MVVLLLDAHNLLYRAFTSLPRSISDASDAPINAVYGMLSYMVRLATEYDPHAMIAAFDTPDVPTFRRERFSGYQAQRGPLGGDHADDFSRQVGIAAQVLPRLNVPALAVPSYEADDIMATAALALADLGTSSIVVSTDRDLLQIVRPGITVMAPGNPPRVAQTSEDVRARLGVWPASVSTFKALAGDASDNIPGVKGIGGKTAIALIDAHETLESIFGHLHELKPRIAIALDEARSDAFLYRDIATVRTDVPVECDFSALPAVAIRPKAKPRQLLREAGYE